MRAWVPTFCISFAAFIFVTSEFIPVGLLPEMAIGLGRSESQTGILMTIYAWIVAVLSLPLTAYTARLNRRALLLSLIGIFVFAHAIAAFATSFDMLVVSRAIVASAHAVFWGIATPLGIRLAPEGNREHAMSVVSTGATLGSVLGIPLGTFLGQVFGWRVSFGGIGVCAAVIGLILLRYLPSTPSRNAKTFSSIWPLLRRKQLLLVYMITVISMLGHYSAFTFITPYLHDVGHLPKNLVAAVLLAFGLAGLTGGFIAPKLLRDHFRTASLAALAIVFLALMFLNLAVSTLPTTFVVVIVWGISFVFFNLVLQTLILMLAPEAEDVAMAGYSGIYNIGIGGGALIGSLAAAHQLLLIGYIGAGLVALSFCLILKLKFEPPGLSGG